MDKKYKFEDASPEDQKAFKDGLDKLLNELSLIINLAINKNPVSVKADNGQIMNGFIDSPTIIVQKKIEITEPNSEIVSPLADEMTKND